MRGKSAQVMRLMRHKIRAQMEKKEIDRFEDLAAAAGMSPTTLYNTMDQINWRSSTAHRLAAALGCSPLDLITVETIDVEQITVESR